MISLKAFAGIVPRVEPHLISSNQAQTAQNTKLWSGALEPFRGNTFVHDPTKTGTIKSIYRFGAVPGDDDSGFWFHWITDVSCIRGPVAGDTQERTYFTGDGVPKVTDSSIATAGGTDYPMNSYELGIPAPDQAPGMGISGPTGNAEDAVNRAYAVTYVSAWGEEGPPSDLSAQGQFWEGQTVDLTGIPVGPGGNFNIATKRIYRTATGASTELDLVAEIPVAQTTYTDTTTDDLLGETIPSVYREQPPADMHGIGAMANGIMYGFSKNLVCVSEAWLPHAWNPLNQQITNYPIVAGGHFDTTIVALTYKNPFLITGSDPRSMTMQEYEIGQGCISARSAVNSKYGVPYASPDGLILVGPGGYRNLTEPFLTKDQWQALKPSSILGVVHEDRYFGFYDTGAEQGCFVLDPNNPDAGLIYLDVFATEAYSDPLTDKLYLVIGDQIVTWDTGAALTATWRSKKYIFPSGITPTAARVKSDSYADTTFRLYVDGALKHSQTITSEKPFRMPSGYRGRQFEVEIEGTDKVLHVDVARTMAELSAT